MIDKIKQHKKKVKISSSMYLDKDTHDTLTEIADTMDISRSKLVNIILKDGINRIKKENNK